MHSTDPTTIRHPEKINVRVLRQDGPGQPSYWERHQVAYEENMNVISVLQKIAAQAATVEGEAVSPVAWDCGCLEEVCGSCTMVINGRVRQSCTALVDRLLEENGNEIELQPMTKFPVIRDLMVDRSRMFHTLQKLKAWVPVDNYNDMGPGPRQSRSQQEDSYPLSQCMTCGCCLEACPQYQKIEVHRRPSETDEQFEERKQAAYGQGFIGAAGISQTMLFNANPVGANIADERLDALTDTGGVQVCGNAQNCVAVCPKEIPLTRSIGRAGRAATVHSLKKMFDR
ncbi:MAG: succinate dehydrogenase iron-sulfur subunit [Planctomycetales bacterium]|nr:succinate dehydrogenase iron-sulfur subunit [Planctomycetales bacterium]